MLVGSHDGRFPPVPPAAAQRLEQRNGVGKAGRFGLDEGERGLQVGLLSAKQDGQTYLSALKLPAHEIKTALRCLLGRCRGAQSTGIRLQGAQYIGHVLEGREYHASVLL